MKSSEVTAGYDLVHTHSASSFHPIYWPIPIKSPGSCLSLPPHSLLQVSPSPAPDSLAGPLGLFLENQVCSNLRAFVLHYFQPDTHPWGLRVAATSSFIVALRCCPPQRPPLTTQPKWPSPGIFSSMYYQVLFITFLLYFSGEHFISQRGCLAHFFSVPVWPFFT